MAKRNKSKFASKSRKSALRVEALEQRQLLATVTGSGTEVGSNIVHSNGNVYDQVLMTGSSVTVNADAGQVTRVSFLDASGDIVQAEFSGSGSLTVSLANASTPAAAANYNQPDVKYVSGLASFTIQGSDATTNFSVFSVGAGNAHNGAANPIFAGGKTGGNNTADIARILVVSNPSNPGGFSTMGGIRAGNAVFSDGSGVVGISALNVNVQGPVIIGDVDATNSGVPTLSFGSSSQFATLTVSGGDLLNTNGSAFVGSGFSSINSQDGQNSAGTTVRAQQVNATAVAGIDTDSSTAGVQALTKTVTLDSITTFDLTGKTQAEITAAFSGRTFTSAVTIAGDLSGVTELKAAEFRGGVSFTGVVAGTVEITGTAGNVSLAKATTGTLKADSIGTLTTAADLGGKVVAKSIGNISVTGALSATVTTDYDEDNAYDTGEKAVGTVTVSGAMSGAVVGQLGIGNVSIGGDLTSTGTAFTTRSGTSGDAFVGNIGNVEVKGDIRQTGALINIATNGTFGNVTVGGAGTNTAAHSIGSITVAGLLGANGTKTGNISITDNITTALTVGNISIGGSTAANGSLGNISVTSGGNITLGTIALSGTGSIGDITVTGPATQGASVSLGTITGSTGTGGVTVGNLSITKAESVTTAAITGKNVGNISVALTAVEGAPAPTISLGAITANNGNVGTIGNIALDATTTGTVTINGAITTTNVASNHTSAIGTISLSGSTISVTQNVQAAKIGAVTHTGATTFSADKGYQALGGLTSFTATGNTTFNSDTAPNIRFGGTTGPALTFNGTTTFGDGDAPGILASNGGAALDNIGSLTFNGRVIGVANKVDVRASSIGDITISGSLTTGQSLVKDFNVYAGNNVPTAVGTNAASAGTAETIAVTGAGLASFSIGNISITSTNTIGVSTTGLIEGNVAFNAIGKIGNVSLQAGGSSAVQTNLFLSDTGNRLVFQTGNGNIASNAVATFGEGIDFDGNGTVGTIGASGDGFDTNITGAIENNTTLSTGATVSIGNISINARQAAATDTVTKVGQTTTTYTDGLFILSGVKGNGTDFQTSVNLSAIDTNLRGTIGNVSLTNLAQQLSVQTHATLGGQTDEDHAGLIAAAGSTSTVSPYGTINGVTHTFSAANTSTQVGAGDGATDANENSFIIVRI